MAPIYYRISLIHNYLRIQKSLLCNIAVFKLLTTTTSTQFHLNHYLVIFFYFRQYYLSIAILPLLEEVASL